MSNFSISLMLLGMLLIFGIVLSDGNKAAASMQLPSGAQEQEVAQLIYQLRDVNLQKNEPDRVFEAIYRLRDLRSPLAIDDLINLIAFKKIYPNESSKQSVGGPRMIDTLHRYPATLTLAAIGIPALPALVRVIEENDTNSVESSNALATVMEIFDHKNAVIGYLRDAARQSLAPEGSRRIVHATKEAERSLHNLQDAGIDTQ